MKAENCSSDEEYDTHINRRKQQHKSLHSLTGYALLPSLAIVLLVLSVYTASNLMALSGINSGRSPEHADSPDLTQPIDLAGTWSVVVADERERFAGGFVLHQSGATLYGQGSDKYGRSSIQGRITRRKSVVLTKRYILQDGSFGKPVTMTGRIRSRRSPLQLRGDWSLTRLARSAWRAVPTQLTGRWHASLIESAMTDWRSDTLAPVAQTVQLAGWFSDLTFEKKCLIAAGMLVIGAVLLVFGSSMLFAPSGLMDRMRTKQYIASQVQEQHQRLRNQWARPLTPGGAPLGRRREWRWWCPWVTKELALPAGQRSANPHMVVLGVGDKGKSRFLASMIAHDIESADRAAVVIDSSGDLIDLVTGWIAAQHNARELASRTTVIDPTCEAGAPSYNPLAIPEDGDLQSAASSIVYGFKSIYTEHAGSQSQWNQQTANILRNAALLLMANRKTLADLPALLQDNDFRDVLLESVEKHKWERTEYGALLETWSQYKKLARTDQWITWVEPILNRAGPLLSDPRIRPIITDPESDINLSEIISEKRILLVKVPQSHFDQNGNLLGSLIVTGTQQAALSLSADKNRQAPVALYLDEFDRFIEKETLAAITSETEKFQIGFVGAGETLQRLPEDFRNCIIVNVGIINCFALAKKDADMLGPQMFRVDGRKERHQTVQDVFTLIDNKSPQFQLISDEEKLNIDRLVAQEDRDFFCYRTGTVAGVFNLRSHDFPDLQEHPANRTLIDKMHRPPSSAK